MGEGEEIRINLFERIRKEQRRKVLFEEGVSVVQQGLTKDDLTSRKNDTRIPRERTKKKRK